MPTLRLLLLAGLVVLSWVNIAAVARDGEKTVKRVAGEKTNDERALMADKRDTAVERRDKHHDNENDRSMVSSDSILGSLLDDVGMAINSLADVDKIMNAVDHKKNMEHTHTYQGFQGMVWPLSVLLNSSDQHPKLPENSKSPHHKMGMSQSGNVRLAETSGGDMQASSPSSDQNNSSALREGDEDYSRSPPFFPTPQASATGNWTKAVMKAREYVKKWTVEELANLTTGIGWQKGEQPRCVGTIAANERLGFPGLCLEDSPTGVRFADLVTSFPAGITTAATFSSELAYKRGKAMGEQYRAKGVNVALTPGFNMVRAPAGGRGWEMGGADPYLSGEGAFQNTRGIQSTGVQACAKHIIGYEQEINRDSYSSNIDARTLHEIYLHPLQRALDADVATIMCSYNLLNNSWTCQNSELINNIVKTQMGFNGLVVSDWGAQHSGVASAVSGLDMSMPGDLECCAKENKGSYWRENLTMAVHNGSVPETRLRDMGTRILAAWYLLGQDKDYPKPNFDAFDKTYGEHLNVIKKEHTAIAREIAAAGAVLLKNENKALPLRKNMRKLAIFGQSAAPSQRGANEFDDRGGVDGVVGVGWGSGTTDFSYLISPYEALQARARKHNTGFYWSFDNYAIGRAGSIADQRTGVDAAIVFVHSDSGENYINVGGNAGDRNNLTLWANGEALIRNVTAFQNNTIVVINAPGAVDMEYWINDPNVTAVIHAHFQGGETGNAIADILYGDVNPSGRLPYTIAKRRSDYPADVLYFKSKTTADSQIYYTEGLYLDYRHFDAKGIEPRFEFGYGLSYTKFSYSNLQGNWLGANNGTQSQSPTKAQTKNKTKSQHRSHSHNSIHSKIHGKSKSQSQRKRSGNSQSGSDDGNNGNIQDQENDEQSSNQGQQQGSDQGQEHGSSQDQGQGSDQGQEESKGQGSDQSQQQVSNSAGEQGEDTNNIPHAAQHSHAQHHPQNGNGTNFGSDSGNHNWNSRPWSWPTPAYMFEDVYELSFDVKNTGGVDGYEVPQVYLGFANTTGEPPKVLRKFDRYELRAGQQKTITYRLNRYDLSVWSNVAGRWVKPDGNVAIYVGASSRDIRLTKHSM